MRTPLVIGNWKMNGTLAEARPLAAGIRDGLKRPGRVEVVLTGIKEPMSPGCWDGACAAMRG